MAEFNCINCKYGMTTDDYEHCGNCDKGSKFVKMTNAERIRAMDDEELAEFIIFGVTDCSDYCPDFKTGCAFGCKHNRGKDVLIKWLQSEAE